jgi:carboxyl-terminal processing protease
MPVSKLSPELAQRVQAITDAVLEHHIDPPARQQMILAGIKALYGAAGVQAPGGLSRRVSGVATREQIAAILAEVWPQTTARTVSATTLEEALCEGLLACVAGGAHLVSASDRTVSEQFEGNRYVGIHISLGMSEEEKRPRIVELFEGGPADRAGVRKDDLIEQIGGVDTKGMELRQAVDRIRGAEGTDVTLKVRQPNESKSRTMTITRGQHPHPTISGIRKLPSGAWKVRLDGPDPIGYLRVTEIAASTPHELRKLARQLATEGARALVLDLRGVRGDNLHPAVLLGDTLVGRGLIGRVRTTQGEIAYRADSEALFRGWPMAILVNQRTSGTAEWLAAALQDHHRAVIVGLPTFSASGFFDTAVVRTTVAVGDGSWSIRLVTGLLERGDGRPLGGPLETRAVNTSDLVVLNPSLLSRRPNNGEAKTGVKPDHPVTGAPQEGSGPTRPTRPGQNAEVNPAADKSLEKAVEILQQSLRKG